MHENTSVRRRRETLVLPTLALLSGGSLFLLLIGSVFFPFLLVGLAVLAVLGGLHYLFWGRTLERTRGRPPKD